MGECSWLVVSVSVSVCVSLSLSVSVPLILSVCVSLSLSVSVSLILSPVLCVSVLLTLSLSLVRALSRHLALSAGRHGLQRYRPCRRGRGCSRCEPVLVEGRVLAVACGVRGAGCGPLLGTMP